MGNRYVNVNITRNTQPVSQAGFGMPLILGISKAVAYKEYAAIEDVAADYNVTTNEYKIAAKLFGQKVKPEKVAIHSVLWNETTGAAADLVTALNALILTNNDWYFLTVATQKEAAVTALAGWAATRMKMFFTSTNNKTLSETLASDRTVVMVHNDPTSYPAEAWVGYGAPLDAGSFTWTFKTLQGIVPSNYKSDEVNAIHTSNGNTYIKEGGVNITSGGKASSGEYIDIIMGSDYIESRMAENIFGLLVNTPKVPFTDAGIALVVAEVEKTLKDAANKDIIAKDAAGKPIYKITAPTAASISKTDKANRQLPNVKWSATLAGAVENVDINGSLEV